MRFELVASLMALAAAAPVDTGSEAGNIAYIKYAPYKGYSPYIIYNSYSNAAEEEAAKMNGSMLSMS